MWVIDAKYYIKPLASSKEGGHGAVQSYQPDVRIRFDQRSISILREGWRHVMYAEPANGASAWPIW